MLRSSRLLGDDALADAVGAARQRLEQRPALACSTPSLLDRHGTVPRLSTLSASSDGAADVVTPTSPAGGWHVGSLDGSAVRKMGSSLASMKGVFGSMRARFKRGDAGWLRTPPNVDDADRSG